MILKPYKRFHTGRFSHGPKKSVGWTRLNHEFLNPTQGTSKQVKQ